MANVEIYKCHLFAVFALALTVFELFTFALFDLDVSRSRSKGIIRLISVHFVTNICLSILPYRITPLSLLDLSVAFDCVDHEILLNRLGNSFGIHSKVLKWLTS